jgi:hypothetical protein
MLAPFQVKPFAAISEELTSSDFFHAQSEQDAILQMLKLMEQRNEDEFMKAFSVYTQKSFLLLLLLLFVLR